MTRLLATLLLTLAFLLPADGRHVLGVRKQQVTAAASVQGLTFPSNVSDPVRFYFSGAALNPFTPATYIWRVKPIQQNGYYTTFFWCKNTSPIDVGQQYYGFHPYPIDGTDTDADHKWEVSANGQDIVADDNGNDNTVVKGVWYPQAATARVNGANYELKFYWDLSNTSKVITYSFSTANYATASPAGLVFGGAPWAQTNEHLSGTLRGIQIYDALLSLSDIQTEAANHTLNSPQTAAGQAAVWYMNQNPTPSDISDKSGEGHNPAWLNSNRPTLYEE